jgi:hypothetical protein
MVPLETANVRRSSYEPLMRKAFDAGSTRSTSSDADYESSSTSAHAVAAGTSCTSTTTTSSIQELQEVDVVGGRSPMTHAHPGNRRYNSLVKASSGQYKATSRREEKSRITNEVIAQIEINGGRFLVEADGGFVEVRKGNRRAGACGARSLARSVD